MPQIRFQKTDTAQEIWIPVDDDRKRNDRGTWFFQNLELWINQIFLEKKQLILENQNKDSYVYIVLIIFFYRRDGNRNPKYR